MRTWDGKDFFLYKNHVTMQSPIAVDVFSNFFKYNKFDHIIEIGTAGGGWSIFLKEQSDMMGIPFTTYDIQDRPTKGNEFRDLDIDFRVRCCFENSDEIANIIRGTARIALFCDGGNKIREVNHFSDFLKTGDFIFAHDYAKTFEYFTTDIRGKWWDWCEISDPYIEEAIKKNNLTSFLPSTFERTAWGAWVKNG